MIPNNKGYRDKTGINGDQGYLNKFPKLFNGVTLSASVRVNAALWSISDKKSLKAKTLYLLTTMNC